MTASDVPWWMDYSGPTPIPQKFHIDDVVKFRNDNDNIRRVFRIIGVALDEKRPGRVQYLLADNPYGYWVEDELELVERDAS